MARYSHRAVFFTATALAFGLWALAWATPEGFLSQAAAEAHQAALQPSIPPTGSQQPDILAAAPAAALASESPAASAISAPEAAADCSNTALYWAIHPDAWPVDNLVIGRLNYPRSQAVQILAAPRQDEKIHLQQEFIAAVLNVLNGAGSGAVDSILPRASAWLDENLLAPALSPGQVLQAAALVQALEEFNLGHAGPPACPDQPIPTPQPTATPTPSPTPTATTLVFRPVLPSSAPTSRLRQAARGGDEPQPPAPADIPTSEPTLLPTAAPTATPVPPTQPPSPTEPPPTSAPPPTQTPKPPKEAPPPGAPSPTIEPTATATAAPADPDPTKKPKKPKDPKDPKLPKGKKGKD